MGGTGTCAAVAPVRVEEMRLVASREADGWVVYDEARNPRRVYRVGDDGRAVFRGRRVTNRLLLKHLQAACGNPR
jgi:hypothetical protein